MAKSKFFRVAVEGATTDGRAITRQDILDMAATFVPGTAGSPGTYGARVWLEHLRGVTTNSPFDALGDVTALKAQIDTIKIAGKDEQRMALYAQIDPLPSLVEMNKARQKIYTSVEIHPDLGGGGKAALVGLAVTDSPASLGTEILQFAAQNPAFLASRKQSAGNLISEGHETGFELDEQADDPQGFGAKFAAFMDKLTGAIPAAPAAVPPVVATPAAPDADANFTALVGLVGQLGTSVTAFTAAQAEENRKLREDLSALSNKIDTTAAPGHVARPLGTGHSDQYSANFV